MGWEFKDFPSPTLKPSIILDKPMTGYTRVAMEELSWPIKGKICLVSLVLDLVYWFIDDGIK